MSSGGSLIGLEIRILALLIKSLVDLGIEYRQLKSKPINDESISKVDLVIKDKNGRDITFQKSKDGSYKIIAENKGLNQSQLKNQQDFINKIRQKYAYNHILGELKKQGYIIAEEEKVLNNTIRIVARKWS